MSAPPILRPLAFGEVLDSAFTLYRRNFGTFVAAALLPTVAIMAAFLLAGLHRAPVEVVMQTGAAAGFLLVMVVAVVGTLVMWGALTHLASQAYGGISATAGEGLQVGVRRFFPMAGAMLVSWLLLMVAVFSVGLVVVVVAMVAGMALGAAASAVVAVIVGLGMFAFFLLAVALLFAVFPAVVVEEKGPVSAIARSIELSRGAVGRLVGLMGVSFAIVYLPVLGVAVLTGTFATLYDTEAAAAAAGTTGFMLQQVLTSGVGALTTPFLLSVIVVQYYDRRVRTEALDVQAAADRLAMA